MGYFEKQADWKKEYFNILANGEIPDFLEEYIETPPMQKQDGISVSCGTIYSKMYDEIWYSSLDHSVGVALIIWNFTKDKKQTLAGLFHDIATPVFKHTIDFMNGDYEKQESTEELTTKIINDSKEIMTLLNRDNIKIEEVCDYHIYPIADNDTPKLSSDRLEYTLSNGFGVRVKLWKLDEIKKIYSDIVVMKDSEGVDELGFKTKEIAEKFVNVMSKLSIDYRIIETRFSMQFLADVMTKLSKQKKITVNDMYNMSEKEIIDIIENSDERISKCFKEWKNATKINTSDEYVPDKYCVKIDKVKVRYINPLVMNENNARRIVEVSESAKGDIETALNYNTSKYSYLNFNF